MMIGKQVLNISEALNLTDDALNYVVMNDGTKEVKAFVDKPKYPWVTLFEVHTKDGDVVSFVDRNTENWS